MTDEELLDGLLDLAHDLGKYLQLPLGMLPKDAPQADLREALTRALKRTQVLDGESVPARQLWSQFEAEVGPNGNPDRMGAVSRSVEVALTWESKLDAWEALDRAAIERDFRAVAAAIGAWIEELKHG